MKAIPVFSHGFKRATPPISSHTPEISIFNVICGQCDISEYRLTNKQGMNICATNLVIISIVPFLNMLFLLL